MRTRYKPFRPALANIILKWIKRFIVCISVSFIQLFVFYCLFSCTCQILVLQNHCRAASLELSNCHEGWSTRCNLKHTIPFRFTDTWKLLFTQCKHKRILSDKSQHMSQPLALWANQKLKRYFNRDQVYSFSTSKKWGNVREAQRGDDN